MGNIVINAGKIGFSNLTNIYQNRDNNNNNLSGNNITQDSKMENVRKQAYRLIKDVWETDKANAGFIEEMENQIAAKAQKLNEFTAEIEQFEKNKNEIKEEYGIADDSQEQKDLELLIKYQNNRDGVAFDRFSEEEKSRLKQLSDAELTEYQKRMLQMNGQQNNLKEQYANTEYELRAITASITDSKIEQEKSMAMIKATKATDTIIQTAAKDEIGQLVSEGVSHIDDENEKNREQAEKIEEEQEKREEFIEKTKEKCKEQEEILDVENKTRTMEIRTETTQKSVDHIAEVQKKINQILKDNKLINEDIKGIEIDLDF